MNGLMDGWLQLGIFLTEIYLKHKKVGSVECIRSRGGGRST